MSIKNDVRNNISLAIRWLTESGIRNKFADKKRFGGINNGYNWRKKEYNYVYHEITGYAISVFSSRFRITKDENYLKYAIQSADYLLGLQCLDEARPEYGAVAHSLSLPDLTVSKEYYSFDNAVILQGLMDLCNVTKKDEYYYCSLKIGNWLLDKMQNNDGSFLACYDGKTKKYVRKSRGFSSDRGCLHIKNAIGLLKLGKASGESKYIESAKRLIKWGINLQNEDGAFRSNVFGRDICTHTHCYATEGLLYGYYVSGEDVYLTSSVKSGDWLLSAQNDNGSLTKRKKHLRERFDNKYYRWFRRFLEFEASDETAQAVRIWLILYHLTGNKKYRYAAERGVEFLKTIQCQDPEDANMTGGFYYHRVKSIFGTRNTSVMYAWCTQFALHALQMYQTITNDSTSDKIIQELL